MISKQQQPGALAAMRTALFNGLLRRVRYLGSDRQYGLSSSAGFSPVTGGPRPLVLILSRRCYQEITESFPVASASQLNKILRRRDQGGLHYHYIGPLLDGQRKVLTITPTAACTAACEATPWVFPVSLLCALGAERGLYEVVAPDGRFFLLQQSGRDWQSVAASALVSNAEKAALILGAAAPHQAQQSDQPSLVALLDKAWLRLRPTDWVAAWSLRRGTRTAFNWRPLVLGAVLLGLLQLVFSSLYLNHQIGQREQRLAAFGPELNQILSQRQQLELTRQRVATLLDRQQSPQASIAIWSTVAALEQRDVRIITLQSDLQQLTLQAEAPSATEVLQAMLQYPFVSNASFSAPVRRGRAGQELFSIVLVLAPEHSQ